MRKIMMNKRFEELEKVNSSNDGTWGTFYLQGKKYNGVVYDSKDGKVYWIFEVKNGLQNGIEKNFYIGSNILEQIVTFKDNLQHGVSKEYDEAGNLRYTSIMYMGDHLKTLEINNNNIDECLPYDNRYGDKLPNDIRKLLSLSSLELVEYKFPSEHWGLNIE